MSAGLFVMGAVVLVVLFGGFAGSAYLAWRNVCRRYPEVSELRHMGRVATLTGGLSTLTGWLVPLAFNRKQLKDDPLLRQTLYVPSLIWATTFVLGLGYTLLLPVHILHLLDAGVLRVDEVAGLYLLIRCWKSSDPLLKGFSHRNLLTVVPAIALVVLAEIVGSFADSHSLTAASTALAMLPLAWMATYLLTWQSLALLAAGSRGTPQLRERIWVPVLLSPLVMCGVPALLLVVHKTLVG
jgi:hypothetical protein